MFFIIQMVECTYFTPNRERHLELAYALNVNPVMIGGAVLSGAYFGDRCSPISTTASLVAGITGTDLYQNIKNMFKSAAIPFAVTCIIYLGYSMCGVAVDAPVSDVYGTFARIFQMNFITLISAILVLLLSLIRFDVKITLRVSIFSSVIICLVCQKLSFSEAAAEIKKVQKRRHHDTI